MKEEELNKLIKQREKDREQWYKELDMLIERFEIRNNMTDSDYILIDILKVIKKLTYQ